MERYCAAARSKLNYVKGAAFGFAAASIWAGQSPITRLGVTTQLDAWDVALLRFGIAGITLIPILLWRGLAPIASDGADLR